MISAVNAIARKLVPSVHPYDTGNVYRMRRFQLLKKIIDDILASRPSCRIIDVGGLSAYWRTFGSELDWTRVKVVVVNLTKEAADSREIVTAQGDARDLHEFADMSFDLVYSNSVIEHVGLWRDMQRMAGEVRRLAPRYFVQTPYFWFPIEPHARPPLLHWLPEPLKTRIVMWRSCGFWAKAANIGEATELVQSAFMLDKRQLQQLFPDARIVAETAFGLTKSIMAIK